MYLYILMVDANLIIYIYLWNAYPSHMGWYIHSSVNAVFSMEATLCWHLRGPYANCQRHVIIMFGVADSRRKTSTIRALLSDAQSRKCFPIQQNSLRWSSQFGMQEHLKSSLRAPYNTSFHYASITPRKGMGT